MAQYNKETEALDPKISSRYEVIMVATGNTGNLVSTTNPLPVTLGTENINIIGNISVPTTVNVASSVDNPVHTQVTEFGNVIISGTSLPVNVSNIITVSQDHDWNVSVKGNVSISSLPSINVTTSNTNPLLIKYSDSQNTQMDSLDRLRVSTASQHYWYVPTIDKDGDLRYIESFTGTGANSYFMQNISTIKMTSGTTYDANTKLTGSAIRATRRRHKLIPGVSQIYINTNNWDGIQPNVVKRKGMFTNYNGLFFEVSDDLYFVTRRRLLDGTLVEHKTPRNQFSIDKLDGTGPSGLDFTSNTIITSSITGHVSTSNVVLSLANVTNVIYTTTGSVSMNVGTKVTVTGVTPSTYNGVAMIQNVDNANNKLTLTYTTYPGTYSSVSSGLLTQSMFHMKNDWWFDFDGSRTGRIRWGIKSKNGLQVLHIDDFVSDLGTHYENAPAIMMRSEIYNTGPVSYLPSLTIGGETFIIESDKEINPSFGVAITQNTITFDKNQHQEFAIVGIGLRTGEPYQRSDLQLQRFQIADLGNVNNQNSGVFEYRLVLNPTLTGLIPTPTNIGKSSRMWDYNTGVTVSGGITLMGGYTTSTQTVETQTSTNFLNMGSNIDYTDADIVVLVVKLLVGGTDNSLIRGSINFIEEL